ncbi:hypothetical protein ACJMK2_044059 [Sinanodonta woodiana]|uniref:C-myc promoter-binding protein n=1 Tax=Sinanodonta woodiana TaxID=1069815 RepID=A0ABD3VZM3_SINWO
MDERRVADYFVVAGLPEDPLPLEEFSNEAAIKPTYKQDPITDVTVINKSLGEKVPKGFICLERTPTGFPADLNHGGIRCPELFICYRRGRDKPPLTDVGVLYEGKERLMAGCEIIHTTPRGSPANVNNSSSGRIYITYRRATECAASDMLAVVDICVILLNKNESPPHSYCQINKNLNKGMVGSDVYLCYKKAMTKIDVLAYQPAILGRYPIEDYEDFPLPTNVPMFCLPMGATIECWSAKAQHPLPVFSTFILTGAHGEKVYGAAVTFYEEFPEEKLNDLQMRHLGLKNKHIREQYRILKTVHANKSICLLSHCPFFDAFRKVLSYLYKISITGPHTVPLERHISHFMFDVPYPSPQRPRILVQLSHEAISISMPEDSPLPQSGASFITLLKNLGPENCMTVLLYMLHEHKILIHSLRPAVLTSVAEAVATMTFPFTWQCPYIPLCPLGLSAVLNAPTPFIVGLDSRYFDLYDPPSDVICVDLDTIRIWPPEDKKHLNYKMLPKKAAKVLQETLYTLFNKLSQEVPRTSTHANPDEISLEMAPTDHDFKKKQKEMLMELSIQEAFLRFMACLMKGYKQYLKPITKAPTIGTTDATSLFDMQGFLKSRDKSNSKFFISMMKTQSFIRFIEERSFVSTNDASLAFFDDCTEKVDDTKDEPKLIELDDTHKSERTVFIMAPEPTGLPEGVKYSYNGFPTLNSELFLQKTLSKVSAPGKKQSGCPNSPVARRTKQEIRNAQKNAQQSIGNPVLWAKCLLSHCYSLWFIHLPGYIKANQATYKALKTGYEVLKSMAKAKLKSPDEVCYRVMLQLCGQYNQPVLAVKVYSEMKKAGVQPNAITYGYYNKAVLEGRWPSTVSKGALLWRKVRNVIIAIAKFRRTIRRRSVSLYSNSGSEYDQISHTSVDSFLEDSTGESKHEPIVQKNEIVIPGIHQDTIVKDSNKSKDDMASSGGTDKGYSSLTSEEAKNVSALLNSCETKTEVHPAENKLMRDLKNTLRFTLPKKKRKKEKSLTEESAKGENEENTFMDGAAISDHEPQIRKRLGSIVRRSCNSVSSIGSLETIKGNIIIWNSAAGLLTISRAMYGESFDKGVYLTGVDLSNSLSSEIITRKRHKSAGDHYLLKKRSSSFFENWRMRHTNGEDKLVKFSELKLKEKDENDILKETKGSQHELTKVSEIQNIAEEIKDSGVALDENSHVTEQVLGSFLEDVNKPLSVPWTSEVESVKQDDSTDTQKKAVESYEDRPRTNSVGSGCYGDERGRAESVKSDSSSPQHSLPTPVTENDPLGLFMGDKKTSLSKSASENMLGMPSPKHSASKRNDRSKYIPPTPFAKDSKVTPEINLHEYNNDKDSSAVVGNVHDSSTSLQPSLPVEKEQSKLQIERTNSFPDSLGNVEKSRLNFWPLRSQSDTSKVLPQQQSTASLNDSVKSDTMPKSENSEFKFFRTGSFRKHKDNLSGMFKYATGKVGAVANKLSEIKQSMTPTKADSLSSLTHSVDESDSETDESSSSVRNSPKNRSSDLLKRSSDSLDKHSLDGPKLTTQDNKQASPFTHEFEGLIDSPEANDADVQFVNTIKNMFNNIAIEVEICSLSRCGRCQSLLYDEEIMAGWSAEDSNLNTSCQFCNAKLVPHLQVYIKDYRNKKNSWHVTGEASDLDSDVSETSNPSLWNKSYGKDSDFCSTMKSDTQTMMDNKPEDSDSVHSAGFGRNDNPWTLQQSDSELKPSDLPTNNCSMSMSEMALAGRRRRTASECLTSATDNMYSSLESCDGGHFQSQRSPLSISIGEEMELPTHPADVPEMKKDALERRSRFDPINVPYLSPLVLRKELENIVVNEGDMSIASEGFMDEHPIIFWNLIWYFKRINVTSHLTGFLLKANSANQDDKQNSANQDDKQVHLPSTSLKLIYFVLITAEASCWKHFVFCADESIIVYHCLSRQVHGSL